MPSPRARVPATITADAAVDALEDMVDAPHFDPGQWSEWMAERLEAIARRIREGLAAGLDAGRQGEGEQGQ